MVKYLAFIDGTVLRSNFALQPSVSVASLVYVTHFVFVVSPFMFKTFASVICIVVPVNLEFHAVVCFLKPVVSISI